MSVTLPLRELLQAVNTVTPAVAARSPQPILLSVLFRASHSAQTLTLLAFNSEHYLQLTIPALVQNDLAAAIPAKLLTAWLRSVPDSTVTITANTAHTSVKLTCGKVTTSIKTFDPTDFPDLLTEPVGVGITLPLPQFTTILTMARCGASENAADSTRMTFKGINFYFAPGRLQLTTTDGYRIANYKLPLPELTDANTDITIPLRALRPLDSVLELATSTSELTVYQYENTLLFTLTDTTTNRSALFGSQLLTIAYPTTFRNYVPTGHIKAVVKRSALLTSINTALLFAAEDSGRVRLQLQPTTLTIRAVAAQTGQYEDVLDVTGNAELQMIINGDYAVEWLRKTTCEDIEFVAINALKPLVLRDAAQPELGYYLIMPMQEVAINAEN
jgi:DNA polymerase III beta subunit